MYQISEESFRAMCEMWGVDVAVKAAKRMGGVPSKEQVEAERQKERASQERFKAIFMPKEGTCTD